MHLTASMEPASIAEAVALTQQHPQLRVHVTPERRMSHAEFAEFCVEHPEVRAELRPDGTLELMSPLVLNSNENEWQPFVDLANWWRKARIGRVYSSTAGFTLPDRSIRSPDAAWLSPETLAKLSVAEFDTMARIVPDFVIEVMSKSDNLARSKEKMKDVWMANGVRLGWLVRPSVTQVIVYRQGVAEPEVVKGFKRTLSADEVVPGFAMDLRELL